MADTQPQTDAPHDHDQPHAVPFPMLLGVFAALMVLTVLTVAVTYVDLGVFNLFVALAIATLKGTLVVAFFMHLWWDSPFNTIALAAALVFVALFIGSMIDDTASYQSDIVEYEKDNPQSVMSVPQSVGPQEAAETDTADTAGQ